MAIQSSLKNMVLSLGVICLVGSGLLAGVYVLTKDPIEAAAEAKTNNAIRQVLPEFDGVPEQKTIETDGGTISYYVASNAGEVIGYAVTASSSGFSGPVSLMVGITADGIVYSTSVLSQSETPGLGAKCTEPAFADQFKNLNPAATKLAVKKDGGDIDAITASTITSRAYVAAVNNALAIYETIVSGGVPDMSAGASLPTEDPAAQSAADTAAAQTAGDTAAQTAEENK